MTGSEPLIGRAASGLVAIAWEIIKKAGGNLFQVVGSQLKLADAASQYAQEYQKDFGLLKLLGMQQAVPLEEIYTAVRFLDDLSSRQFISLEALEEAYRESQIRRFQTWESRKQDGMTVTNQQQYLMVLGGPGAGKSTFLRRVGLEALKGKAGRFQHDCIPVFLELKRFDRDEVDLSRAIARKFENSGFPLADEFAAKALQQGKLLVLLDGLDEVPKVHLHAVVEAIQEFVAKYDKNRFIASCRIAAHRSSWNRFRDIELADFDDEQIKQFIHNWFRSDLDKQAKTAERCWEILSEPENAAAKELAHTPLLLTFLCLVYDRTQGFPTKRATLYRKALDILLEEWAAEKRITPGEIYQGLNTDLEKVLLAEIAYRGFDQDQLFLTQQELVDQIKAFLSDTVDKPKYLDGKAVLDAIAIQQGVLVERAEDVFSFSHLTLQEYLTAQYVVNEGQIEKLVAERLTDSRWREVFLLVAGLLGRADDLLERMQIQANQCINTEKLHSLLTWADQATAGSTADLKPAAKRSVAIFFLLDRSCDRTRALDHTLARALAHALAVARALALVRDRDREFEKIKISQDVKFAVLITRLEALKARVPENNQPLEVRQEFARRIYQTWLDAIHFQPEWVGLSEAEVTALTNYLSANELMIQCKEAAVRVSREKWEAIEERMLTVVATDE